MSFFEKCTSTISDRNSTLHKEKPHFPTNASLIYTAIIDMKNIRGNQQKEKPSFKESLVEDLC